MCHFLPRTAVINGGVKTFKNNFKGRAESIEILIALLTIGNGGENAQRPCKSRPRSIAQIYFMSKNNYIFWFLIVYHACAWLQRLIYISA